MKARQSRMPLPIGRTAVLTCQIEALRYECCEAAAVLMRQQRLDEAELDECARLDDALADAHRILKATLGRITLARLKRRSRAR
jgi:hypothetical protein